MKNNYLYYLLLILVAPIMLLSGCDDEELVNDPPSIVLSTTRASLAEIDLNAATGPTIRAWAVAEVGLQQVRVVAETIGGTQELINETSFTDENSEMNGTRYEIVVLPAYTPDFNAIVITVTDIQGRTEELRLNVNATGGDAGPAITGFPEGVRANIRETVNIRPAIRGIVNSHFGLASVRYVGVYGNTEEEIETISSFGDSPNEYEVDFVPDYNDGLQRGMTAIRIEGTDGRGNQNEVSIPVTIVDADPAPVVTFNDESVEADLTASPEETPEVSGTVESEYGGLAEVRFYLVFADNEEEIEEEAVVFDEADEEDSMLEFGFTPDYRLGLVGIKVVATDDNGQETTEVLPVSVIADDPNLRTYNNVDLWATGQRASQPSALDVTDGNTYVFDQEPTTDAAIAGAIHFIAAAPSGDAASYDIFSPSASWLDNNYFKEVSWPQRNATKMRLLEAGEIDFESASSIAIEALPLGETTDRVRAIQDSDSRTILFETEEGNRGLIHYVGSDEALGKNDRMTFSVKYITQ